MPTSPMALHLLSLIATRSVPCVITDGGELRLLSKLVFAGLVEAQFDPNDQGALRRSSAQTATVTAITPAGRKALDEMQTPAFRRGAS